MLYVCIRGVMGVFFYILLMSHLPSIINIILRIVNLCFSSSVIPAFCKSAIISPLIKKTRSGFRDFEKL